VEGSGQLHILSALYALDRGWVSPIVGLGKVMNTKSFLWQELKLGCWAHSQLQQALT